MWGVVITTWFYKYLCFKEDRFCENHLLIDDTPHTDGIEVSLQMFWHSSLKKEVTLREFK